MAEPSRYAVLSGTEVVNVMLWDGEAEWTPPEGSTAVACPDEVGPGWTYVDGTWTAPIEEEPA